VSSPNRDLCSAAVPAAVWWAPSPTPLRAARARGGRQDAGATLSKSMKKLLLLVLVVSSFQVLRAQSVTNLLKPGAKNQEAATSTDPLGRDTPAGTVLGFLQAAQTGDYKTASEFLQLSGTRRQSQGLALAEKLKLLMNRAFVGSLRRLSTTREGNPEYGTSDRQTIGTFSVGDTDVPVVLVQAVNPSSGKVWLFSAETLAKVPELHDAVQAHQVETRLPQALVRNSLLGMPLWQWLALLLTIPVAIAIGLAVILLLAIPRRLWLRFRNRPNLHSYHSASRPLWICFSALAHRSMAGYFGLPLLTRIYYYRIIGVVVSVGFFWFLLRATSLTMQRLRVRAISAGRVGAGTLMVLGQRLLTALVLIVAILATLSILGFNLTTVLAGLGIGGIAIAFAAQKTLENLFGGISVLADEVIRVGDYCRFGDRTGTVEDISLRSTRVRTDARTQLSIPNGALATMNIENFTRRDKILFNPVLQVRYETTPEQLRYLLAEIRRMLYAHPKVGSDSANIRFANFDSSAIRLEIFAFVLTRDSNEFAAVREDLLLRIMDIVEKSGSALALPSQTLYLTRDHGLNPGKAAVAQQQVKQWREEHKLPFPDFSPADKSNFRGSIDYPEPESATGNNNRTP
jgi:MscS family membrane protein